MAESLHIVCPHCQALNRMPAPRLEDRPRCGRCRAALFDGVPAELSAEGFDRHVNRGDIPVVVDFWAPWCGPCKTMAPAFVQAAAQLEPGVRLAKVNTEAQPALAARYGIRSIPTLVIFHRGGELARQAGAMGAADIIRWVRSHL